MSLQAEIRPLQHRNVGQGLPSHLKMTTLQKTFLWKRGALHKVKDYQPFGMVGHSPSACLVPSALSFDDLFVQIPPEQKLCTPNTCAVSLNIVEARYTNSLCMFAVCTHDTAVSELTQRISRRLT